MEISSWSSYKNNTYLTSFLCTGLIVLLTYLLLKFCKSTPLQPTPAPVAKPEDSRPKLSISGHIALSDLPTTNTLGEHTRLYLIFQVQTTEQEEEIRNTLKSVTTLEDYRILFCETEIGYRSIVRQLNPRLHIDDDSAKAREMRGYTHSIALVTELQCEFYQLIEYKDCHGLVLKLLLTN